MSTSTTPPSKRIKLEDTSLYIDGKLDNFQDEEVIDVDEDLEHQCSICLQSIVDRTVIPTCSHEFCFECLKVWSEQSRRCPLCSQSIGGYLIHGIRSRYDFRKHYLAPLRTSPVAPQPPQVQSSVRRHRTIRERERDRRIREEMEENDKLHRSIEKRRWIYKHDLYAKHVASNSYTRYRPYPSPAQFASSTELISRTTTFLRRELQVWNDLDVEFLTTFIISLMKSIDIRSESAVKLLAEFLDMDTPYVEGGRCVNAEHFAHEVYSYVRSPFRDLFVYDTVAQYDALLEAPDPQQSRWRENSRSRSRSRSRHRQSHRERDRSASWSPSGRQYPSSRVRLTSVEHLREKDEHNHSQDAGNLARNKVKPRPDKYAHRDFEKDNHEGSGSQPGTLKGKERASNEPHANAKSTATISGSSSAELRSTTAVIIQEDCRLVPPSAPSAPSTDSLRLGSDQRRPPRNRNLLESIQAHLTLGSRNRSANNETQPEKGAEIPRDNFHELSTAPSLLARMTDDTRDVAPVPAASLVSPQSTTNCISEPLTPVVGTQTKMITPEFTLVTRAGLAKNTDNTTSNSPANVQSQQADSTYLNGRQDALITSPRVIINIHPELEKQRPRSTPLNVDAFPVDHALMPSDQDNLSRFLRAGDDGDMHNAHRDEFPVHQLPTSRLSANLPHQLIPKASPHVGRLSMSCSSINNESPIKSAHIKPKYYPPPLDARKRLLSRLEAEKNQARGSTSMVINDSFPATSVLDRTFPEHGNGSSPAAAAPVVDPQVREAELRKRAQLQVRLATEKRSNDTRLTSHG